MKINKKYKKKMEIIKLLIFLLCIGGFFLLKEVSKNETDRIFKNGKYVIGIVTEFSSGSGSLIAPRLLNQPGMPAYVKYKYTIKSKVYIKRYDANTTKIPLKGVKAGDKYLVIYHKKDPKKSRMLFDRPIKDSSDFERYVKDLKNNPEKIKNYHK